MTIPYKISALAAGMTIPYKIPALTAGMTIYFKIQARRNIIAAND